MANNNPDRGTKFSDMPFGTKMKWIGKFCVSLLSMGFIYPNVMHD